MFDRDDYYLHQNTNFILKTVPDIEKKLDKISIKSDFKISSSENGFPILVRDDVALNNPHNPIKENIDIFESLIMCDVDIYVICGFELGHLLNFFNDNCKGFIIVFEDDLELLKYTLSKVSFIKILCMPKVFLVTNFEELDKIIKHIRLLDGANNVYPVANEYYSDKYADLIQIIKGKYS